MNRQLDIVFLGLSITSSWGNGHATTFRSLIKELDKLGHKVTFFERDKPWYASNRDMPAPPFGQTILYNSIIELEELYSPLISDADLVIVGSYVPEGVNVGKWVIENCKGLKAFYDIDTPVTLAKLERNDFEYLHPDLISGYDLYFSFTGGPVLEMIESKYGAPKALPLYCSVDTDLYYPEDQPKMWDLGYLGTYSDDRQPGLEKLMLAPARLLDNKKFVVAGPQYPPTINWPTNVERIEHLPPVSHRKFYNQQLYTLNITRKDMIAAGYSPSVRLFEAAACGVPIISDYWEGLNQFFEFDTEILVAKTTEEAFRFLSTISKEERLQIGSSGRQKILSKHTASHRAKELESYAYEALESRTMLLG